MKIIIILLSLAFIFLPLSAQNGDEQGLEVSDDLQLPQDKEAIKAAYAGWWKESRVNYKERMSWFNEAKFGCFIHWGVYSNPGGIWNRKRIGGYTEHLMRQARIPLEIYKEELVKPFNPEAFDADEWMRHAYNAGMKYFIITAKHHDGFAMYFSEAYPYDLAMTAYKKDPMAALRESARKYGIKFGFYYSHAFDWEYPDAPGNDWDYPSNPGGDKNIGGRDWWLQRPDFLPHAEKYVTEKSIPQIQELIRKYDPDILWFDTPHKLPLYENIRILEAIRQADPENKIVVNGRLARFSGHELGDYVNTGDRASFFYDPGGYWESIPTTNESYGYSAVDTVRKPVSYFIRLLASATSKGGNILMNVGPMGNGKWDNKDISVFEGVGAWLKINGEAIYNNERTDIPLPEWGVTTRKGDTLYAHVYSWPVDGELVIGGLASDIGKVWIVSDVQRKSLSFHRINDKDITVKLPRNAPDKINTVVALQITNNKPAYPIRLLDTKKDNTLFVFDAVLTGNGLCYGDGKTNRNYITNWTRNDQSVNWNLRILEPVEYDVYIDYNTASKDDTGTVLLNIGENKFEVNYTSFTENKGRNSLFAGRIKLKKGEFMCTLIGQSYKGAQYMRPIAVRLIRI